MRKINLPVFILLLVFTCLQSLGQQIEITGKVTSMNKEPLPGVNVIVQGANTGTITDAYGNYSLKANSNDTLQFSIIGFMTELAPVNHMTKINVVLIESIEGLDEVIVVGYGTSKKSDLTGSLVSISSKEIENVQNSSITDILQGRAAGVDIVSGGGSPGSGDQITIRGVNSINNSAPLWIVDGVPTSGNIHPFDIESIEILKDASAAAIYGTKGAGGVILVTTKQGKKGEASVTYNSRYSFGKIPKKLIMISAQNWARLRVEAYQNAAQPVPESLTGQNFGQGTDWIDAVTRTAFSMEHYASVSGSSDRINYRLSVSDNNEEGIVKKTDNRNTALRINSSVKVNDWLKIGENLSLSVNTNHEINADDEWNAILIQAIAIDPITPVTNPDGSWGGTTYNTIDNPVAHIDRTHEETRTISGGGSLYAQIDFTKDLQFRTNFGFQQDIDNFYGFNPTFYVQTGEENAQSSLSRDFSEYRHWISSNYLTYSKTVLGNHNMKFMLGYDTEKSTTEWFGVAATDLISENLNQIYFDNASGNLEASAYGLGYEITHVSSFGRLNYDYKSKYLVTLNFRNQGSSLFGPDKRYGNFPSASFGWKISEEQFIKDLDLFDLAKLRFGYGKTGNDQPVDPFSYTSTASAGQRYVIGGQIVDGAAFLRIANPEMHWEEKEETNIGVDLNMFNSKLTFSGDFFVSKTNDMLYPAPLPGHVGTQEDPVTNVASMKNIGFELQVGHKNTIGEIEYSINFNFNHVKNEVLSLGAGEYISAAPFMQMGYISRTEVGHPIAMFYGYVTDGLFQNWEEVYAHVDANGNLLQPNAAPGDIRYRDADGDGELDLEFIGDPHPDFTAGLILNMKYRNFELSAFFYSMYGHEIFNATKYFTMNPSMRYNVDASMTDRWLMEGDTDDPNHARLNINDANNNFRSDRFVEDGSFLRLKNLQLSYTLPKTDIKGVDLSAVKIFVGSDNLFTITKYSAYDPEIGTGWYGPLDRGIDRVNYPNPKTYYFGMNIHF